MMPPLKVYTFQIRKAKSINLFQVKKTHKLCFFEAAYTCVDYVRLVSFPTPPHPTPVLPPPGHHQPPTLYGGNLQSISFQLGTRRSGTNFIAQCSKLVFPSVG